LPATRSSRATPRRSDLAIRNAPQKTLRFAAGIFFVLALAPATALAVGDSAYDEQLVARARELRLAERPEWHKLLHYVPNLVAPGFHSLVDSPEFFNAAAGKNDPQAELEGTLLAFGSELEETPQRQNPQCAFIARRAWLDEQLHFDRRRLQWRECKRFDEWHAALDAKHLTLVFAAAYLNNPSSMYGHTLLRVDASDQNERTRLLAYTLNFYANTNETNGVIFALRALWGAYPGSFSILPYYIKVREYNDMENRDLWEYELNFTPEEVERIVRHAWELQAAYFDYYFFDENCAYHLLGLLQVARPELDLAGPFRWWAIPSDTIRAVVAYPGLVAKSVYRPANATVIERRLSLMSADERTLARDLSQQRARAGDPRMRALPPERAAAVLEASYDYVNYRRATGKHDLDAPAAYARELLLARSRVDAPPQTPVIPDAETRPELGHGSSRVTLGAGRLGASGFAELRARGAYHDLLDPDPGYSPGAQIEFFNAALRHYSEGRSEVESFIPIDIVSLSPRDDFFGSVSWKIAAGWWRQFANDGSRPLSTNVEGGAGLAWALRRGSTLYAFLDSGLRAHPHLDDGYQLGAGATLGALVDAAPAWRLHAYVRGMSYFLGERDRPASLGLEQRLRLSRDVGLRLDLSRRREGGTSFNAGSLSLLLYF
jgi:hypothetical protein